VLTSLSGGSDCATSEVAVVWSKLNVTVKSDCTYSLSSKHMYSYPTSFAKVTYPGPYGPQQPYNPQAAVTFPYEPNNARSTYDQLTGQLTTTTFGTDFKGFTEMLSEPVFPPAWGGPFGPRTNTPANYTYKLQLPSTFLLISPLNGCTYTFRMVSGPAFGGMKPSSCTSGKDSDCPASCPVGKYKATVATSGSDSSGNSGGTSYICALCPAGTISSKDSSSCQPCSGATVAPAVGSVSCSTCPPPYIPSPTKSACGTCHQISYDNPTTKIYDASCKAQDCPKGTFATVNNECIGGKSGQLCVAKSLAPAAGGSSANKVQPCTADPSSAKAVFGGAIMQLLSSDTSKPGCKAAVGPLAKWLEGKRTYMGFNLTETYPSNNGGDTGVQWQVLGSLEGSNLGSWPICGNAHGGPGPQPGLTVTGTALGEWGVTV
jgi:hypothetical protein